MTNSMTASPKEILSESPDNFYHMGSVRKAAPPPPIYIPPKINQVQADRELGTSLSGKVPSPPAPKLIGKRKPAHVAGKGKKQKAPPPPGPQLIGKRKAAPVAGKGKKQKAPPPPGPQLIGKRRASSDKGGAKKAIRTMEPAPTSASLAPLAIGKRKNGGGGEISSKKIKTVPHRNIKGLKINVAGVGGVPTTGPLSASAAPKSSDELPKRNPTRAVKIKVTPKPKKSKGVSKKRK